ncbi:hypothetical protein ACLMJK_004556 [Lecanora helva]
MGVPSISERKHYRLVPGEPEEPTSTIVLTSKDSYYVDIRILLETYEKERDLDTSTTACVDWAFAGKCRSEPQGARENGMIKLSHTIWDHWIDSRSDDPGVDEGDMWVQRDGDILERGKQKHPDTGEEIEYEELWHDLEVIPLGKKNNRSSLVIRAEDSEKGARGLAVKVGGFCQAILKTQDGLTIERWEHKSADFFESEAPVRGHGDSTRTHNDWIRTFRFGKGKLPCEKMCANTLGKIGLNRIFGERVDSDCYPDLAWRVVEEYYW